MRHLLTLLCFLAPLALADDVAVPNTLSNNSVADADAVQQNFQTLVDESNENDRRLDDAEASVDTLESFFPADSTAALSTGGWYTIAYRRAGGSTEAAAYFMLRNDTSGIRQVTVIYASIAYGRGDVKVLQNRAYTQTGRGFTAVRIRKGDTYDEVLLQVQVTVNSNSQLDQLVVARLMGREQSKDNAGWVQTDWVPDGDPIDSVNYSVLTAEITKSIPTQVQYLSDFDCTKGQVMEWDDTLGQWECADKPETATRYAWVDSDGDAFCCAYAGVLQYVFPESDLVFDVYGATNDSWVSANIYYTDSDCGNSGGTAYVQMTATSSTYLYAGRGPNGWLLPDESNGPLSIDLSTVGSQWSSNGTGCSQVNSSVVESLYPVIESSVPLDLGIDPPFRRRQVGG